MSSRFHVGTLTKAKLKSPQVVLPVKQKKLATFQERDIVPSAGNKVSYLNSIKGQENLKEMLQIQIDAYNNSKGSVGHWLFTGPSGLGKTKFANAFAADLGLPFYPILGNRIKKWSEVVALLSRVQENDIIFIDEIHALRPMFQNNFYNILQDFTFDDIVEGSAITYKLPKFSLWGATTHVGYLNEALKNRFTDIAEMVPYTRNQLTSIIVETAASEFGVNINNELAYKMSNLVRGTPRYAVNMIQTLVKVSKAYQTEIDIKVLTKSLQLKNLDPFLGLDFTARKYLFALYDNGSMGTASIGIHINEEEETVIALEKFLFSHFEVPELDIKGPLIVKGLGKKLSLNGRKYIDGIKKLKQNGWFLAENWD